MYIFHDIYYYKSLKYTIMEVKHKDLINVYKLNIFEFFDKQALLKKLQECEIGYYFLDDNLFICFVDKERNYHFTIQSDFEFKNNTHSSDEIKEYLLYSKHHSLKYSFPVNKYTEQIVKLFYDAKEAVSKLEAKIIDIILW